MRDGPKFAIPIFAIPIFAIWKSISPKLSCTKVTYPERPARWKMKVHDWY